MVGTACRFDIEDIDDVPGPCVPVYIDLTQDDGTAGSSSGSTSRLIPQPALEGAPPSAAGTPPCALVESASWIAQLPSNWKLGYVVSTPPSGINRL